MNIPAVMMICFACIVGLVFLMAHEIGLLRSEEDDDDA